MKIEIFGPGCPRCHKTESIVRDAVNKLGIQAEVVKVSDFEEFIRRGVMATPALFVNGSKKIEGKIPSESLVLRWIQEESQK